MKTTVERKITVFQVGWLYENSTWYYYDSFGVKKTGWVYTGGKWYYLNGSGAMQTGWLYTGGKWYFFYSNGSMAANTWVGNYWLNASGAWTASR